MKLIARFGSLPKLLRVRWTGQLTDGMFQSALASFILFSPERQPDAVKAALAFAVVLLPYSVVGPYVGIFLDRFSRKRVVQFANLFRALNLLIIAYLIYNGSTGLTLTFFVLISFGANRLILAGLSAGLPLLVNKKDLVSANALAVTGGTISQGFNILKKHGDALRGIFGTGIQRGGITALTLMALLLERNTFNDPSDPDAGLRGFAYALAIAGIGIGLGALAGPYGVAKFGRHKWMRISMIAPIGFLMVFGFFPNEFMMILTAFFVGGFGQSYKITNDALVQSKIADEFRGRIFAFYDVAVNGAIVSGAMIAALTLPPSGVSLVLPWLIAISYTIAALVLLRKSKFSTDSGSTT